MKKEFKGAGLVWRLNNESVPFVVLGYENACEVYSSKMELLTKVAIPFKPYVYAVVSDTGILVLSSQNQIGLINVKKGTFTNIEPPTGTSVYKRLSSSILLKVDDGFVFLTPSEGTRKYSFHYSPSTNGFRRVKIELPWLYSSVNTPEQGAYCWKDEQGDVHFCSFETAYREKRFVREMSISKEMCACYHDINEISCNIVYLSIKKKTVLFASPDKPDTTALAEYTRNVLLGKENPSVDPFSLIEMPNSGKLILIKDGKLKTDVKLCYRPEYKRFNNSPSNSVIFVSCPGRLEAYSVDDLTLLASLPIYFGPKTLFLPDGGVVYEDGGDVHVSDSSPLAVALKVLEKKKQD